jgi:predicted hotdog family 3-hydroxylacyl-ACP dehydratase
VSYMPIEQLLPHEPPMLWLDRVLFREGDQIRCSLEIRPEHVFVDDGVVEPVVSIEWMAQTVGALVGIFDRGNDLDIRPGYLIAVPEATFDVEAFSVGDQLVIEAKRVWGDDEIASFECAVARAGQTVAKAQLSVYRRALPGGTAP